MREDQLEPFEVEPRFLTMLDQRFAQFRGVCLLREPREMTDDLRFRVVQVAKLVEVEILQRCNGL